MTQGLKILLVDDDQVDRMVVDRALRKVSPTMEICEAVDMTSGIEALKEQRFDCVIVDYILPDGNGVLFVKTANEGKNPAPPIIILTGQGGREADLKAMQAGAAEYLEKDGLKPDVLDRTIRYAIQNSQLVKKLKETNERLTDLDRLKTDFLSTASHELRTPLTIIQEFIALVHDGLAGPLNEEQTDCLASALKNCKRLGGIINDLLDLQRIESGKTVLVRKKHDLTALVERCCNDFKPAFEKKGQKIACRIEEDLPCVLCDEEKITQVLINLIGNAHKFTPPGGRIEVSVYRESDRLNVAVQDNGPGINCEDHGKIFDKFTQLKRNLGPGKNGTGLGLAITRKIMEFHDEQITIKSQEDKGSRFAFTLPLYCCKKALRAFIQDRTCTKDAREKDWTLVCLGGERDGASIFSETDTLRSAEAITRRSMRCDEDSMLYLEGMETLAILLQCKAEGGAALKTRLTDAVRNELGSDVSLSYEIFPLYYEDLDLFVNDVHTRVEARCCISHCAE